MHKECQYTNYMISNDFYFRRKIVNNSDTYDEQDRYFSRILKDHFLPPNGLIL